MFSALSSPRAIARQEYSDVAKCTDTAAKRGVYQHFCTNGCETALEANRRQQCKVRSPSTTALGARRGLLCPIEDPARGRIWDVAEAAMTENLQIKRMNLVAQPSGTPL